MATITTIIPGKISKIAYTAANATANPPAAIRTAINTVLIAHGWTSYEASATGHSTGTVYKQTDLSSVDKYALVESVRVGSTNQIKVSVFLDWVLGVGPSTPAIASTVHSIELGSADWAMFVYGDFPSSRADVILFN